MIATRYGMSTQSEVPLTCTAFLHRTLMRTVTLPTDVWLEIIDTAVSESPWEYSWHRCRTLLVSCPDGGVIHPHPTTAVTPPSGAI